MTEEQIERNFIKLILGNEERRDYFKTKRKTFGKLLWEYISKGVDVILENIDKPIERILIERRQVCQLLNLEVQIWYFMSILSKGFSSSQQHTPFLIRIFHSKAYLFVQSIWGWKYGQNFFCFKDIFAVGHIGKNHQYSGLYSFELNIILDIGLIEFLQLFILLWKLNRYYDIN